MATGVSLRDRLLQAARQEGGHPLAPRRGHAAARATNLIIVNLTGGLSHIDSFDYKPRLQADHGKTIDWRGRPFFLNASPFRFRPYGESGLPVSELFPHLARRIDDLAVIRSMVNDHISHGQATLAMHCGLTTVPMPSIGSWISYGLGTGEPNLPPFVVLASALPYMGNQVWAGSRPPPQEPIAFGLAGAAGTVDAEQDQPAARRRPSAGSPPAGPDVFLPHRRGHDETRSSRARCQR